jgi:hypothetical protein
MDSTLRRHVRSEASAAAARVVAARAAAERAAVTREVAAHEASAAREASAYAAAALEAAAREARATREVAVLATAARSAVAAARAAAIRWSVQRVRQRPYAWPSRQRGARLRTPSDDEEEQDGLDGDAAKKEEHDGAAKKVMKLHSVNQNLTLDEPKSSTMPKCSMQQAFPWLHLLMLLHNELVMVVILVFPGLFHVRNFELVGSMNFHCFFQNLMKC